MAEYASAISKISFLLPSVLEQQIKYSSHSKLSFHAGSQITPLIRMCENTTFSRSLPHMLSDSLVTTVLYEALTDRGTEDSGAWTTS